ncbi:hypothetical protein AX16_004539 [Volvariella volvacea WC 439]|nr:hypothetical protein AX16_004539 [Volvariella volvacea WC 439]
MNTTAVLQNQLYFESPRIFSIATPSLTSAFRVILLWITLQKSTQMVKIKTSGDSPTPGSPLPPSNIPPTSPSIVESEDSNTGSPMKDPAEPPFKDGDNSDPDPPPPPSDLPLEDDDDAGGYWVPINTWLVVILGILSIALQILGPYAIWRAAVGPSFSPSRGYYEDLGTGSVVATTGELIPEVLHTISSPTAIPTAEPAAYEIQCSKFTPAFLHSATPPPGTSGVSYSSLDNGVLQACTQPPLSNSLDLSSPQAQDSKHPSNNRYPTAARTSSGSNEVSSSSVVIFAILDFCALLLVVFILVRLFMHYFLGAQVSRKSARTGRPNEQECNTFPHQGFVDHEEREEVFPEDGDSKDSVGGDAVREAFSEPMVETLYQDKPSEIKEFEDQQQSIQDLELPEVISIVILLFL